MSVLLRGGSELTPASFGPNQDGGLFITGGKRKTRRSGKSRRSGSKRKTGKRKSGRKTRRRMRGGNQCGGPTAMTGGTTMPTESMSMPSMQMGGARKLKKRTGKARRHRTKSYMA
jgi:hypothetical protein